MVIHPYRQVRTTLRPDYRWWPMLKAYGPLVRRPAEQQAVSDFLEAAHDQPCALVIEGEPGIGKTALWLDAVRRAGAEGFTVLSARAAMSESVLAYTVLADLLHPVDDTVWDDLPVAQRKALSNTLFRQGDESGRG